MKQEVTFGEEIESKYLSFSSCQDIDPDANYPPILVTTSTRDDRVHPGHARKFVKVRSSTMQRVSTSVIDHCNSFISCRNYEMLAKASGRSITTKILKEVMVEQQMPSRVRS